MLQFIGSLIAGPFINGAINAYKAKLESGNTRERIAADLAAKELALQERERQFQAQVLVAEQGNWFTRWIRPVWAAPFVLWTWKVVVYDGMLGLGVTDDLRGAPGALLVTVAGSYFLGRSAEKVASIIKGREPRT